MPANVRLENTPLVNNNHSRDFIGHIQIMSDQESAILSTDQISSSVPLLLTGNSTVLGDVKFAGVVQLSVYGNPGSNQSCSFVI